MKNGDVKKERGEGRKRIINGRIKDTRFAISMHCLHISVVINFLAAFPRGLSKQRPHILCVCRFYLYNLPRRGDGTVGLHTALALASGTLWIPLHPPDHGFRNLWLGVSGLVTLVFVGMRDGGSGSGSTCAFIAATWCNEWRAY